MINNATEWRRSSYSGQQNACVELRRDLSAARDSKDPTGRTLQVALRALLTEVKSGRFDC